jgi:hypothetical protein
LLVAIAHAASRERYPVTGMVLRVDPARLSFVASIEQIPGFMAAMTMPFDVKDVRSSCQRDRRLYAGGRQGVVARRIRSAAIKVRQDPLPRRLPLKQLGLRLPTTPDRRGRAGSR